jgi:hypothetical protein
MFVEIRQRPFLVLALSRFFHYIDQANKQSTVLRGNKKFRVNVSLNKPGGGYELARKVFAGYD